MYIRERSVNIDFGKYVLFSYIELKKIYDFRSQKNILFISKMALTVEKRNLFELVLEYAKL